MGAIPKLEVCNPGIRAAGYNVLVVVEPVEQKTAGGIILTAQTTDKERVVQTRGRIVNMGPVAFSYDNFPAGSTPAVGDAVVFARLAGGREISGRDGQTYRIILDKDVCALIDEDVELKEAA